MPEIGWRMVPRLPQSRLFTDAQWLAMETGLAEVAAVALRALAMVAQAPSGGAVRDADDRLGCHRCGDLRPQVSRGRIQPPRPAGWTPRLELISTRLASGGSRS